MNVDKINVGNPDMTSIIFEAALEGYKQALNDMVTHMLEAQYDSIDEKFMVDDMIKFIEDALQRVEVMRKGLE